MPNGRRAQRVNTLYAPTPRRSKPLKRTREQRIGERITVQPNGCWIYGSDPDGYGKHRFVWETLVGPIPEGHHLHHTCKTPACCNPAHLEPLTPLEHRQVHRKSA